MADKAARLVAPADAIVVKGPARSYVSRGGDKLAAGLDGFGILVEGCRALDAGASTGGFTDCLLQRGARQVVAVDVGYGQLHERLRDDERVDLRERTNVRTLDAAAIGGEVDIVVADLSFISLRTVAGALLACAAPQADLLLLVKPQFEAGRAEASRGRGVIRDPEVHARVLEEVCGTFAELGGHHGDDGVAAQRGRRQRGATSTRAQRRRLMATVAILLHHARREASTLAAEAVDWLVERHHEVRLPKEDASIIDRAELGVEEDALSQGCARDQPRRRRHDVAHR